MHAMLTPGPLIPQPPAFGAMLHLQLRSRTVTGAGLHPCAKIRLNARPSPLQLPALSPNGYSVLVLAVFRAAGLRDVFGRL
jgi:hypothetical protein